MEIVRWSVWSVLLLGTILALGCGESEGDPTVAVTGTVTHKGSPLEGAVVSFVPTDATTGTSAVGVTDAAGKYSLTTRKNGDGALPGSYKVSITKYDGPKATTGSSTPLAGDELHPADYTGEAAEAPPPKNLLPAKYASPDSSGLTATVASGDTKPHDFDVEG